MKRIISLLVIALAVLALTVQAQGSKSTTRLQVQHKYNKSWIEKNLKKTEASLIVALNDSSVNMQASAVQTLRELEQILPEYPFTELLTPLGNKLKDENTNRVVRRLVALALEALHSEAGDAFIQETGQTTKDPGLATLCEALLVKGGLYK